MKKIDRTGEVKENLNGLEMKIIEYKNNKEVRVLFTASGETRLTTYLKFKQGKVYPTWKNKTYNKNKYAIPSKELTQDIRDVDLSKYDFISDETDNDEPSTSIAISIAMLVGLIGLGGFAIWFVNQIF